MMKKINIIQPLHKRIRLKYTFSLYFVIFIQFVPHFGLVFN